MSMTLSRKYLVVAGGRQRPWRSRAPWPSAGLRYQLGESHQIVGGGSEGKSPSDAITATEPGLLLPGDRLDPAECLLDALADALADNIAAVPGRSPINRRTAAVGVLRNVRRHLHRAQFVDEVFRQRLGTLCTRPAAAPGTLRAPTEITHRRHRASAF